MRIRKQVYDLTNEDLESFPVWEFALDEEGQEGQDEATVRPHELKGRLDPASGMFVAKAKYVLADGSDFTGYLSPPVEADKGDLGIIQPIIITPSGQVNIWHGIMEPPKEQITRYYKSLGKASAEEVFPLKFASVVEIEGGPVEGVLTGFLYFKITKGFFSKEKRHLEEIK